MDISVSLVCAEMIIKELMDSSSSSDEEFILELLEPNRQPRSKGFTENVVHAYSEYDFKKNLRVSRECATHLIERYSQSYSKRNYQGGKIQTSVETQVLVFLWFSGNKTTYREVANIFEISLSNVHRCFNSVLNFLFDELAPELIKFPRLEEEKEVIANEFKKVSGIPNILGCIGRRCIAIKTPKYLIRSKSVKKNDKVSITLQGICDSKLRFLDIFTGIYNNMHNSVVLKHSSIGKELADLCCPKYHLLGDSGYLIREYLLTPYIDDGNLTDSDKNYNTNFCRTRVKIENAFRVLKCRFRQLMRMDFHNVETMEKFVTACCVLHNICIERNESLPEEISNTELNITNDQPMECDIDVRLLTQLGQLKRDQIKNILFDSR